MKFKKNYLIYASAWAIFTAVLSDILLISAMRNLGTDVEKRSSAVFLITVPIVSAALCLMFITAVSWRIIRRQRRRFNSLEGHGQYAFFRNWVCALAVGAVLNTVLLCSRLTDVLEILRKEEDRRIHQLYFDKPEFMRGQLSLLDSRLSSYTAIAIIMTVLLSLAKAAAYLFSARTLVKCYHKHAAAAYGKEVRK